MAVPLAKILPLKKPVGYRIQVLLAQFSFQREMKAFVVVAHLALLTAEVTKRIMMATGSTLSQHGGP